MMKNRPGTELNLKSSFARNSFALEATEGTAAAQQAGHYSFNGGTMQEQDQMKSGGQSTFFGEEPESGSAGH